MRNLVDDGLSRTVTSDNTLAQVCTYQLRDKLIVRGVSNMSKTKVEEHEARIVARAPAYDEPADLLFVDPLFQPCPRAMTAVRTVTRNRSHRQNSRRSV